MIRNNIFEKIPINFHSWKCFFIFLLINIFLSYSSFSTAIKVLVGLLGFGLLLIFYILSSQRNENLPVGPEDSFKPHYLWTCGILAGAILVRFWHLTRLSTWPMPDEGLFSFYALELARKWHWNFFFSYVQVPPITVWALSLFYKWIEPSLFSLWLFPATISVVTVFVIYVGAKKTFPASFTFLLLTMASFNFTFLYSARFCTWPVMVLFWTVITLVALSFYVTNSSNKTIKPGLFLGFITGLGFFVAISWPVVAFSVVIAVLYIFVSRSSQKKFWVFFASLIFVSAFFLYISINKNYGSHLLSARTFHFQNVSKLPFKDALLNLASLFWIAPLSASYGPLWGGMLNPVMDAFFFWGILECFRIHRNRFYLWLLLSLGLFCLPGLVSKGFEIFRNTQIFPLLILVSAIGAQNLLKTWPSDWKKEYRTPIMGLLLASSVFFDLYHLMGPYHHLWGVPNSYWKNMKSVELDQAYNILEQIREQEGTGALLLDLQPNPTDTTLMTATFPFDAAHNPALSLSDVRWIAVVINANYKPFLASRFPQGRWFWLEKIGATTNQAQMLGVIPFNGSTAPTLKHWILVNQKLEAVTTAIMTDYPEQTTKPILDLLFNIHPEIKGDPFLESCFWEKVIFHSKVEGDYDAVLSAINQALAHGYSLPELWNDKGFLLEKKGKLMESKKAYQKAIDSPLDLTPAAQNLVLLNQKIKLKNVGVDKTP